MTAEGDGYVADVPARRSMDGASEERAEATPSDEAAPADQPPTHVADRAPGAPTRDEMVVALTPGQLAVGGAIVAGLLVIGARLLLGRRRGRR